jgi:hypothetical protein
MHRKYTTLGRQSCRSRPPLHCIFLHQYRWAGPASIQHLNTKISWQNTGMWNKYNNSKLSRNERDNVESRGSGFELHFDILFPIFQNNIFGCIFHHRTQIVHHSGGYLSFVLRFFRLWSNTVYSLSHIWRMTCHLKTSEIDITLLQQILNVFGSDN